VENLASWGVTTLAPQLEGSSARRRMPLFPGYIFARFDAAKVLHNIHYTRGVAHVVSFGGVPARIPDEVIAEICSRMNEEGVVRQAPVLTPGDEVVIQSGFLREFAGVFEREIPGSRRVQILLATLAYSAHLQLPSIEVAKIAS
jgi:transcriptional antiterminator RfaH